MNLDIDGFLTSTQFVTQLASFLSAIITAFLAGILGLGGTSQ